MIKKAYIELVQQALGRQNVNYNQSLIDGYISAYMSAMLNYLQVKQYYIDIKAGDNRDISGYFYATYTVKPVFDDVRAQYYLVLPQKLVALPNEKGLPYVGSIQEDNQFIPIGQSNMYAMKDYMRFTKWVYYQIEGTRIYFKNLSPDLGLLLSNQGVLVKMVVDAYDLNDNDELPVPAGMEKEFVDGVVDFFLGKKRLQQDLTENNKEI